MNILIPLTALVLFFLICLLGPLTALAEMHEITSTPKVRCGPHCVIQPFVADTKEELESKGKPYQMKGSDKWFVDVMMTEAEAGRVE